MTIKPQPPPNFAAVVQSQAGLVFSPSWLQWFAQFSNPPAAISTVAVGASPFTYTASGAGYLSVSGGTVLSIVLTRGGASTNVGFTGGLVPMVNKDAVTVTYTGAPTMSFIPG